MNKKFAKNVHEQFENNSQTFSELIVHEHFSNNLSISLVSWK